jgi:hypothetical protein
VNRVRLNDSTISQYDGGALGELSAKTSATVSDTGNSPHGIAIRRNGKSIYVANGAGGVGQFDVTFNGPETGLRGRVRVLALAADGTQSSLGTARFGPRQAQRRGRR